MTPHHRFFQALLSTLLFFAGALNAMAQTSLKVTYIPTLDATPIFIGLEKGYFKEQGLDVTPISVPGGAAGVPGLMGGAYDILFGNIVSTLVARQEGFKVLIVAPGTKQAEGPVTTGLIVRKGEGIRTGKDLENKTVAVNTRNGVIWLFARSWIAKTGGDPSKVRFREVAFPQMNDALRGKQIDAAFQVNPFFGTAIASGEAEAIADPYREVQPGVEIGVYLSTEDFYAKNTDTVGKFNRALVKSIAWYNGNTSNPDLHRIIAGVTKLSPDVISKLYLGRFPLRIDPEMPAATAKLMKDAGLLTSEIDAKSLIATEARN